MYVIILPALPLIIGVVLDLILGDPYSLPHPVRLIGSLISLLDKLLRRGKHEAVAGAVLSVTVLLTSAGVPLLILVALYHLNLWVGIAAEGIMCYYLLAARCLQKESMKVCRGLEKGDVKEARRAVSMIVGRDTDRLDEAGIIRAAVETVAENTSDGVTAPMFYIALFGAVGGFFYKAANTMDSMLGYKNEKYLHFGRFAAKLDDVLNYVPSRLSALTMIVAAHLIGMDGGNAWKIWRRDRRSHASPNSAQTEAAAAGALNIRLAGDAWYFGELHRKPAIGDCLRPVEPNDIRRVNRLMYATSAIFLLLMLAVRIILWGVLI